MRKYLEKPIVIQWNMKNNIYNNIIVKKVCELTPIKLRFIDPHSIEDFRIIDEIIEYSSIQHYQIEYDIADLNIEEISYLEHQKLNFYIKFDIFEFDEIMRKKLVEILNKCEKAQILIYITHKNIRETIELVKWLYNENKANIFYICPKKKVKNSLINTEELHKAVTEFARLYIECKDIKLSLYDEEKIVRDILDLNYYKYGNLYITSQGSVSLYKFLPDYEYGLTTETVSIIEVWKKICTDHLDDLDRIKNSQRYWFKYLYGGADE